MAKDKAYQEAEKKIEAVRWSRAWELDLSVPWHNDKKPKLTELPESLGQLTQLQTLNLSGNQLTALPESLGQLTQLQSLDLSRNQLTALPDLLGQLTQLQKLNLSHNQLTALPESLGQVTQLQTLDLSRNQLTTLPESLGKLTQLQKLNLYNNRLPLLPDCIYKLLRLKELLLGRNPIVLLDQRIGRLRALVELDLRDTELEILPPQVGSLLSLQSLILGSGKCAEGTFAEGSNRMIALPEELGQLSALRWLAAGGSCNLRDLPASLGNAAKLESLDFCKSGLSDLPPTFSKLAMLNQLKLENNPLNPELAAAYKEGLDAVKSYLRARVEDQVVLNEAKLILIGEGEVGKSALLGALRGDEWVEKRYSTHGIEIKPVKMTDPATGRQITLNGWDFGGQRVYRPTHQLFFSAPAVYLVVWKPREGPQQGFVKEWIKLVKHREVQRNIGPKSPLI